MKSDIYDSREQCTSALFMEKSTFTAKKKTREKREAKTQETRNPNRTLIYHGMIGAFESFSFYSQFIGFFFFNYLI